MTSNAVSVILPVLNEEDYLVHAVEAILQQKFTGQIEVLLSIGPSIDRTMQVAEELAKKDSRVRIIENPTGRTAAGLNLAIKHSKFPVIVRVDGHSNIPENYIEQIGRAHV